MSWWMKINVPDNVSLFCHIWKMWDTHCCINIRFVDREFRFKEGHRSTKNDTFPLTSRYKKRGLIRLWTTRSKSSERKRKRCTRNIEEKRTLSSWDWQGNFHVVFSHSIHFDTRFFRNLSKNSIQEILSVSRLIYLVIIN